MLRPISFSKKQPSRFAVLAVATLLLATLPTTRAGDHNDPNAVNSAFSDIPVSAADLYDIFGWPSDDKGGGEKLVLALTFAPMPRTGVFDNDVLYRIKLDPDRRLVRPDKDEHSLETIFKYADALKDKYLNFKGAEIRVTFDQKNRAKITFIDFPGGSFTREIDTNKTLVIDAPGGHAIKTFIGGRDDAFFNDLPGFFRSINYVPQFYNVPHALKDMRELKIPKTLLELDGNTLFNFDPKRPELGISVKEKLPANLPKWSGNKFQKDKDGNFRFVYTGKDARAGLNINSIILEMPLAFVTRSPREHRVVNAWGESWVLKASSKVDIIRDEQSYFSRATAWVKGLFSSSKTDYVQEISRYKRVDTVGVPFADAGLSEREDERQLGANNIKLAPHFVMRFSHLGWGFGPSISALGLGTCFDHGNSPVSVDKTYSNPVEAFPRIKKCLFQELNMPDNSWNNSGAKINLKRTYEVFTPNVNAIDMDTTGTWPFGRRPEDQVATRFLSTFLDMAAGCGGKKCTTDTLGDQALWDKAPIVPKTPPNPLKNDKPFLKTFPYLAEPW
jgi:Domain of unknown function (DUF4331)